MTKMICPLMSGPVSDGTHTAELIVECRGSLCAFWRWNRNTFGETRKPRGRCGYATGAGGEFFDDPQTDGEVPPRTDGGGP